MSPRAYQKPAQSEYLSAAPTLENVRLLTTKDYIAILAEVLNRHLSSTSAPLSVHPRALRKDVPKSGDVFVWLPELEDEDEPSLERISRRMQASGLLPRSDRGRRGDGTALVLLKTVVQVRVRLPPAAGEGQPERWQVASVIAYSAQPKPGDVQATSPPNMQSASETPLAAVHIERARFRTPHFVGDSEGFWEPHFSATCRRPYSRAGHWVRFATARAFGLPRIS